MKRCPECDFIYLDTDDVCDLDGTALVSTDEAELSITEAAKPKPNVTEGPPSYRRPMIAAAFASLVIGIVLFVVYFGVGRSRETQVAQVIVPASSPSPATVVATPEPSVSPSPEASPTSTPKPLATDIASRAPFSRTPVSTSVRGATGSGRAVIRLSNGARIEADEVWRTKEGVWYRRSGLVTLIKTNQVKAIERSTPR